MRAFAGDELTVRGRHEGDEDRHGEILQVEGADGAPQYLVRWQDGHISTFYPSSDGQVEHRLPEPGGVR
jgi:hypothetical protein